MSPIDLYLDADAMRGSLVAALRSHGVTAITSLEAGLAKDSDEAQLAFATGA